MAPPDFCPRGGFQSPEHRRIGDRLSLHFPDSDVRGADFRYAGDNFPGDLTLSFGQIVALAGDFYGNWKYMGDATQISDEWRVNPQAGVTLFTQNSQLLNLDTEKYLQPVLDIISTQEMEIESAIKNGQDPAQAFKRTASSYDTKWTLATKSAYLQLALCDWDHFGDDAISAYSAGHTAALIQARLAQGDRTKLTYAYFLDAFACHFLTDLFSTGHMRTPRRVLHSTYTADDTNAFWPADQCNRCMHDEDCANGLWVRSADGSTAWAAYGDSQLFSAKANQDFDVALAASQRSVDEVWTIFKSGGKVPKEFGALKLVPDLGQIDADNFAPLFKSDSTNLYLRTNVDDRSQAHYESYPLCEMSESKWSDILKRVDNSGSAKNMLPLTLDMVSPTRLVHFIAAGKPKPSISLAEYANTTNKSSAGHEPVDSWNMCRRTTLSLAQTQDVVWSSAQAVDKGVYGLVGRCAGEGKNAYHAGVCVGDKEVKVVWEDRGPDDNADWTAGSLWYGRFDTGSDTVAMIKHWYKDASPWESKLELWTFGKGTQGAPTRITKSFSDSKLPPYDAFAIRIDANNARDTFVTTALTPENKTQWSFSTWSDKYTKIQHSTCEESVDKRAQKIIVKNGATTSTPNRVIRLFYGEKYSKASTIRIDVLQISSSGITTISSSQFPVTWPGKNLDEHYLTWFLSDVDGDGTLELVTLVVSEEGELHVLVFKPKADEKAGFESPIVSSITTTKGDLLTAPFMKPLMAHQARYAFPKGVVDSAVMMVFDNYGVLGVRLLRPKQHTGTLEYEIGGQVPAAAGQKSVTLGQAARLFHAAKDSVGLLVDN